MLSRVFCTVHILAVLFAVQGQLTVKFSEDDYEVRETGGALETSIQVSGGQQNGVVRFRVDAYTAQQFRDRRINCVDEDAHDFQFLLPAANDTITEAELADLEATSVTCTRPQGSSSVTCSIPVAQDDILEGDEFLVLVLTVEESAGNTITLTRNCSVGRILAATSPSFNLSTAVQTKVVTEGTRAFIALDRNFRSNLPLVVSLRVSNPNPSGGSIFYIPPNAGQVTGGDYLLNDGQASIIFPASETRLMVPLDLFEDDILENDEHLTVTFTAQVNAPSLNADFTVDPATTSVVIQDNDVLTVGLNVTQPTITVTEGDSLTLCAEASAHTVVQEQRTVFLDISAADGTATGNEDFTAAAAGQAPAFLDAGEALCYTYTITEDNSAELPESFQVMLVDEILGEMTDPAERLRHMTLNQLQPGTVTVYIQDKDIEVPNRPQITFTPGQPLSWTTDEEGGTRPVMCYYGSVIEEGNEQVEIPFDFCADSDPRAQQFSLPNFNPARSYTFTVCARNSQGDMCSDTLTVTPPPPPPTTPPPPPPTTPAPTEATTIGGTGEAERATNVGLIVGVVVAVLVLLCCLLLLLILLIICCCCDREKRYFPETREKKYAAYRHNAHYSVSSDDVDIVKQPLSYV